MRSYVRASRVICKLCCSVINIVIITFCLSGQVVAKQWSGTINEDTVWTVAESPHEILGNLTIEAGVVLFIEPGASVISYSGIKIYLRGDLLASSVDFYQFGTSVTQFYIYGTSTARFENCTFSKHHFHFHSGSSVIMDQCSNSNIEWLVCYENSSVLIQDCGYIKTIVTRGDPTIFRTSIGSLVIKSGAPGIRFNVISSITYEGGTPSVWENTLTSEVPLIITDPELTMANFIGNVYTDPDPRVRIKGTFETSRTLGLTEGIGKYETVDGLTIAAGVTVSIKRGRR